MAKTKKEEPSQPEGKVIKKKDYEVQLQAFNKESYALSMPGNKEDFIPGWYPYEEFLRAVKLVYPNGVPRSEWFGVDPDENGDFDPLAEDNLAFLGDKKNWDKIKPYEIEDVFKVKHLEHKRFLFRFFGPEKVFHAINPKKIAEETITKKNHRWNDKNVERVEEIQDTYELFEKPLVEFFPELKGRGRENEMMYIVRMTCTSTGKTHFIFVDREVGAKKDPIAAIAWTFQLNITDPEKLFRQGDIIMAKESKTSKPCTPYHLTKADYLRLMYAET